MKFQHSLLCLSEDYILKWCHCDILSTTLYFWCYSSSGWFSFSPFFLVGWRWFSGPVMFSSHIFLSTSPSTSWEVYSPWTVKSKGWLQEFAERGGGGEGQDCPVGWVSNARVHTRSRDALERISSDHWTKVVTDVCLHLWWALNSLFYEILQNDTQLWWNQDKSHGL